MPSQRSKKNNIPLPIMDPDPPIHSGLVYRICLPLVAKLCGLLKLGPTDRVLRVAPNLFLKFGPELRLNEAHAMQYVAEHTSLEVPRVVTAFCNKKGCRYILMTRFPGKQLYKVWPTLSVQERCAAMRQLRSMVEEYRSLTPPQPGRIGSATYTPMGSMSVGPFDNVEDLHRALRGGVNRSTGNDELDIVARQQSSRTYSVHFTHGDLAFYNILYHKGKLYIIDWERSGWLPDYWEYTNAWAAVRLAATITLPEVTEEFLTPYPLEFKMECLRLGLKYLA